MKPYTSSKDFGKAPSGDMGKVKTAANGSGTPEKVGSSSQPAEPGKASSGEMGKVKQVANICPTGTGKK